MNRPRVLLIATALLAPLFGSQAALAVVDPVAGPKDSRIRTTPYDPGQVVRLTSTGLSPLQVIFEDGERPVTIAGALVFTDRKEAKDWLARPSGKERHYSFELRTRDGSVADTADPEAYMTVRLTYPAAPSPEAIAAAQARREAAQSAAAERAVRVRFAQTGDLGPRNYNYDKRDPAGCPLLAPMYVYDDGTRTTLLFAPHAVLPEIYVINQDGKEAVATTVNDATPTGLRVMVPSVQREMRLRRGGKVCALRDNAFDPIGAEPGGGNGTVSPDVVRRVRAP